MAGDQVTKQSLNTMTLQLQEAACGCEAWVPDPVCRWIHCPGGAQY